MKDINFPYNICFVFKLSDVLDEYACRRSGEYGNGI